MTSRVFLIGNGNDGVLPPTKTTAQKNAITTPPTGLVVYDIDLNAYQYYNGTSWVYYANPSATISSTLVNPSTWNTLATGWSSSGTLQTPGNNNIGFARLLTTAQNSYLEYTFSSNLALGTYGLLYTAEYENNRGIMDVYILMNGGVAPGTLLNSRDLYRAAGATSYVGFVETFTVTSSSSNVLRFSCTTKNASSSGYITGVVTPFIVFRIS